MHSSRMRIAYSLLYRGRGVLTETLPGQRPPRTETPGQRSPWTETPGQRPLDRDPPGQRSPSCGQTPVKTLPSQTSAR